MYRRGHQTIDSGHKQIEIITKIHATIPLRESAYIGLVINELVTNAYKYAFQGEEGGAIQIILTQKGKVTELIVEDNGKGYTYDPESRSLGLKLIRTLVTNQLRGTIEVSNEGGTRYTIRFEV
jgi:two-component sensor histidine kinase